jgi:hypothetical protein
VVLVSQLQADCRRQRPEVEAHERIAPGEKVHHHSKGIE